MELNLLTALALVNLDLGEFQITNASVKLVILNHQLQQMQHAQVLKFKNVS